MAIAAACIDALSLLLCFELDAASVELEFEAEFADLEAFAASPEVALEFSVAARLAVLFEVPEIAFEEFEVELLADPPLLAAAVWLAPPETAELLAPLFPLLLFVELSLALALPSGAAAVADSVVPAVLVVSVVVPAFVPAAVSVAEEVFPLVAFNAALAVELLDAAFVAAELLADIAALLFDALLLELSFAFSVLLDMLLVTSLLVFVALLVLLELLVALWFSAPTRLREELLVAVVEEDCVLSVVVSVPW